MGTSDISSDGGEDVPEPTRASTNHSHNREPYQDIVRSISDLLSAHTPPIGDCSRLPHPKKTILYAIAWMIADFEERLQVCTTEPLGVRYRALLSTLMHLLTILARDWHEIDPHDRDAVARLATLSSFPDWAQPLKEKYISDDKASLEAFDVTHQVMLDRSASHIGRNAKMISSDPTSRLVTQEMLDTALNLLRERGFGNKREK